MEKELTERLAKVIEEKHLEGHTAPYLLNTTITTVQAVRDHIKETTNDYQDVEELDAALRVLILRR